MSVYRRRVMQVKHPPNQITAVYNVTSTSSTTKILNTTYSYITGVIVDGERLSKPVSSYKFPTTGEHEVKFMIANGYEGSGNQLFYYVSNLVSVDFSECKAVFTS